MKYLLVLPLLALAACTRPTPEECAKHTYASHQSSINEDANLARALLGFAAQEEAENNFGEAQKNRLLAARAVAAANAERADADQEVAAGSCAR